MSLDRTMVSVIYGIDLICLTKGVVSSMYSCKLLSVIINPQEPADDPPVWSTLLLNGPLVEAYESIDLTCFLNWL